MSGTIHPPSYIMTNELVDNTTGLITAGRLRDLCESSFAMVTSPNGVKTASYTAQFTDRGTIVPFNVASGSAVYTIPPNSSVAFPVNAMLGMLWVAGAAIQPSFAAGSGVAIANSSSLTLRVAGSIGWAWQYAANVWYLTGDFT